MSNTAMLEVKNLTKHFKAGKGQEVHAVDNVSSVSYTHLTLPTICSV